ncbi:glycosyltransferase [Shewanella colwelliana]|uniref:glycosyltransferase n=1 Tax=Shewanella colwelliana TaxID=23 RepID=UPI003735DBB3
MILVTNKVKKEDYLKDERLSQAGLLYQEKLSEFLKPELEIALVPSFVPWRYNNTSEEGCEYVNVIATSGHISRVLRYISDSMKAFSLLKRSTSRRLVVYNLDVHNLLFVFLSCFFSSKRIYLIVADYILHKNIILRSLFDFLLAKVDGVIVLNDKIDVNSNSLLLPGLVRKSDVFKMTDLDSLNCAIFSGSIGRTTGIELCLQTVSQMRDINLYISGKPYHYTDREFKSLKASFEQCPNIFYQGLMERNEYSKLLNKVSIAFSLRDPHDIEHDYNFPSKILEYLASGKFVISSKRYSFIPDGIIYYCDYTNESLSHCLRKILDMSPSEIEFSRQKIYDFMLNNYSDVKLNECINKLESKYEASA